MATPLPETALSPATLFPGGRGPVELGWLWGSWVGCFWGAPGGRFGDLWRPFGREAFSLEVVVAHRVSNPKRTAEAGDETAGHAADREEADCPLANRIALPRAPLGACAIAELGGWSRDVLGRCPGAVVLGAGGRDGRDAQVSGCLVSRCRFVVYPASTHI